MIGLIFLFVFLTLLLFMPIFSCNKCQKKPASNLIIASVSTPQHALDVPIEKIYGCDDPDKFIMKNYPGLLHRTDNFPDTCKDFLQCSGKPTFTPGTMPTFGLWTTRDRLNSPDCLQRPTFEWPNKPACTNEHLRFPIQCGGGIQNSCTGTNCRIRGALEDTIYRL
jgi:hypothetical protein